MLSGIKTPNKEDIDDNIIEDGVGDNNNSNNEILAKNDIQIELQNNHANINPLSTPTTSILSIQLTWKNVIVSVDEFIKNGCHQSKKNRKTILNNLSGTVLPGQFLAILGSTGAGKTTLLNYLSGKSSSPNLHASGKILINGIEREKVEYAKFTAFVQQDDVFMNCLTIQECLLFTARCKCQGTLAQHQKRVHLLLEELSLFPVKDQRIGGKVTK